MHFSTFVLCFLAVVALSLSEIVLEDEDGQQFYLTPVSREKRQIQGFGSGGGTSHGQSGNLGFVKPNGAGANVGYGHANGFGHTASVDARVPVWTNKNRYGETSVLVGGGTTHHFGGPGGSQNLDKRGYIGINHRF